MSAKPLFLLLTLICLFGISFNSFASKAVKPNTSVQATELMHKSDALFFEENKGQLSPDPLKGGTQESEIKYYGHSNGVYLYCKPGMLSFVFTKVVTQNDEKISEATGLSMEAQTLGSKLAQEQRSPLSALHTSFSTSRMDLVLLNSNSSATITATDQQEYYENFYTTGDADHGITNVHTYRTVTYKNIYPHIDMILKAEGQGMEYSFLVHPGGNVGDIQLRWDGVENIKTLSEGMPMAKHLKIEYLCALGKMEESAPKSFVEAKEVESNFLKKGGIYSFEVSDYNKTKDLLIDPKLTWATYFGGDNITYTRGVCTDKSGNVYLTGPTGSSMGLATSGAYKTSCGYYNAFLAKFSSAGTLAWATYYGGNNDDEAYGISIDSSRNIYITGKTNSKTGIATSGAYQTSSTVSAVIYDTFAVFLAKFSSSGALDWGTYYGGESYNTGASVPYFYGYNVSTDDSGYVYITGHTASPSGIATSGAYQTSYAGGYLAKFNTKGRLVWGTYFGGYDAAGCAVATDKSGNIYIAGYTSDSGIATKGAYLTSFTYGYYTLQDAFLAKFTSSGALSWATYYGGNEATIAQGVCTDSSGNAYITGYTSSTSGIATSGAYKSTCTYANNSPDSTQVFLAKFTPKGALSWGTYYGGTNSNVGNGVSTDGSGNVYITGYTQSSNGIATSGAYRTSYSLYKDMYGVSHSGCNAFLAKFSSAGALSWGTYYGGGKYDEPYAVCSDNSGNVYISGETQSTTGIATSGAFMTSFNILNNTAEKAFLAKFSFSPLTDAGISSVNNPFGPICPGSESVKVNLENYGASTLISDSIYWKVNGTAQTPKKWTGTLKTGSTAIVTLGSYDFSPGTNSIVAWSAKPNSIKDSSPKNDTAKMSFIVNPLPAASVIANTAICSGATIYIGAATVTNSTYSWTSSAPGFSSTSSNPSVSPVSTASYTLTETNANGCTKSDSVMITVNALPVASVISNTTICSGSPIFIGDTSVKGSSYSWASSASGFSSTSSNPSVSPTSTASYTLVETNSKGCMKSNSVTIVVNSLPAAKVISDTDVCSGSIISIGADAVTGSSYFWSSSDSGFSSPSSNPSVSPASTDRYTLTEKNVKGCTKSNSVTITVNPLPAATVISNTVICSGSVISIGAAAVTGSSYSWASTQSGFSSTSSNPSVSPTSTASYTITETNSNGCVKSNSVSITVNPLPIAFWVEGNISKDYYFHVKDSSLSKSSYTWDFGDNSAGATGYTVGHVFPKNKSYTVKLKVTNTFGCTAEDDSMINVTISGIAPLLNTDLYNLNIYPNPFTSKTLINFTLPQTSHVKISVMDMRGNMLYIPTDKTLDAGPNQVEINAAEAGLSAGTYFVNIEVNGQIISKKIIRIRN